MLKKIGVSDVRLGMYIQEVCGSWLDHPFWKKSFLLNQRTELVTLQNCGIREVWIDTDKGHDVESGVVSVSVEEEAAQVDKALQEAATAETPSVERVPLSAEFGRAKKIHGRMKVAVTAMFREARMGNAININETTAMVDDVVSSVSRNAEAFLKLSRFKAKNEYTYLHSVAVCGLMIALGRQLGLTGQALKDAGTAGLLHDVGKMLIPDAILNKPGKLTDEEFATIKTHPQLGYDLLVKSGVTTEMALDVCLHHHERVDGKGYPKALSGEPLTLFARMGAVCDVYDALTSNRSYKEGWEPAATIRKMAEWKDGHFDEAVFSAFVKTVGIYPTGTLVKLKSGKLGVVMEQSSASLTTPIVKAFFSTKTNAPIAPLLINLAQSQDSIVNIEKPEVWKFDLNRYTDG